MLGSERRIMLSAADRRRTAYHEAGHALVGMLTPGADPVRKISIVPRGHALGVTFQSPDADRYSYSASYLRGRIAGMLAGRAAEELVYDDVTTGAENDLEQATEIAKQMVGRWGMSETVGMLSALPDPRREQPLSLGGDGTSPATLELVETEARRILDQGHDQALETLRANRHRLDTLVEALLRTETLDTADAYRAAGVPAPAEPQLPARVARRRPPVAPEAAGHAGVPVSVLIDPGRQSCSPAAPGRRRRGAWRGWRQPAGTTPRSTSCRPAPPRSRIATAPRPTR